MSKGGWYGQSRRHSVTAKTTWNRKRRVLNVLNDIYQFEILDFLNNPNAYLSSVGSSRKVNEKIVRFIADDLKEPLKYSEVKDIIKYVFKNKMSINEIYHSPEIEDMIVNVLLRRIDRLTYELKHGVGKWKRLKYVGVM